MTLDCPACEGKGIVSRVYENTDWVKIAYVIPLLKLRNTRVQCGACEEFISCTAHLPKVSGQDAKTIAPWLRYHATAGAKVMSIIAFVFSLVPVLGVILASIATFIGRGTSDWPYTINIISLIISVAVTVSAAALFVI